MFIVKSGLGNNLNINGVSRSRDRDTGDVIDVSAATSRLLHVFGDSSYLVTIIFYSPGQRFCVGHD